MQALETLLNGQTFDFSGGAPFEPVNSVHTGALNGRKGGDAFDDVPGKPLEIRYMPNHEALDAGEKLNNNTDKTRVIFWSDMANHVVELLTSGQIPDKVKNSPRDITPNDIAILVNSHADAEEAVRYLRSAGSCSAIQG